ncbi:hypothetical protein HMPREF9127_0169 [Parvimonas sp. oral taxon 393 str. F0440]|nr:hypothetical protein HMPREF9127_0169 [Parvimonas sp. oral taxon 393 str. F0440]
MYLLQVKGFSFIYENFIILFLYKNPTLIAKFFAFNYY